METNQRNAARGLATRPMPPLLPDIFAIAIATCINVIIITLNIWRQGALWKPQTSPFIPFASPVIMSWINVIMVIIIMIIILWLKHHENHDKTFLLARLTVSSYRESGLSSFKWRLVWRKLTFLLISLSFSVSSAKGSDNPLFFELPVWFTPVKGGQFLLDLVHPCPATWKDQ